MRKLLTILLLSLCLISCSNEDDEQLESESYIYESPYVKGYNFPVGVINRVYYNYHDIFAGVYLIDGSYNINITEGAPESILAELTQNSLVTHHIVEFSFAELWTIRELITVTIIDLEGFSSIGISEMDNTIKLTLITGTVIPESFDHYVEIGILTINYTDSHATTY